ncbi:MAG: hypothetical protein ACKO15_03700 [Burkholderiales bacterium]
MKPQPSTLPVLYCVNLRRVRSLNAFDICSSALMAPANGFTSGCNSSASLMMYAGMRQGQADETVRVESAISAPLADRLSAAQSLESWRRPDSIQAAG